MTSPLVLGAYPFGLAAGSAGIAAGPPDDFDQIRLALDRLRGTGPPLLTRAYVAWTGPASTSNVLEQIGAFLSTGLTWDLVLAYRNRLADLPSWCEFVAHVVHAFGTDLAAIQVTGEANLTTIPGAGDGAHPGAVDAVAHGVLVAARAKAETAASAAIGFAVVPDATPATGDFWPALAEAGGPAFAGSVDYVGLDLYPDMFGGPVPSDRLDATVVTSLRALRNQALPIAGITAATPIRICETGWPTGPGRSEPRQAEVLDTVLRSVHRHRREFHVTHWQLFSLRDADSSVADPFHQFGILHDDYSPKPAFHQLRRTISELTSTAGDAPHVGRTNERRTDR